MESHLQSKSNYDVERLGCGASKRTMIERKSLLRVELEAKEEHNAVLPFFNER